MRQESLVVLVNCEVFIMVKGRKSCSRLRGWREKSCRSKPEKANARAVVISELDSAPLSLCESGQPSRRGEARIAPEASTRSKGWTLRGERRQRAQKEPSGTWEAWHGGPAARRDRASKGNHNLGRGHAVASERPVVAEKPRLQSRWSQGALLKSCRVRSHWS